MPTRVRTESDRARRKESIIAIVTEAVDDGSTAALTMAEIAQRCGLSKGTLYLYYETKEELLLATIESELSAWYASMVSEVATCGPIDARRFASIVVSTVGARRALPDLLPQLRPLLQVNRGIQVRRFRERMRTRTDALASALESAMDLPAGEGQTLVVRTQALVAGLAQVIEPADGAPTSAPGSTGSFARELRESITAMVRGMIGAYA
jgi:AcrR family transcriptional regulator